MAEIMTAKEAVERYIHTGTQVCWGGFSYTRRPFTICREVIRQRDRIQHHFCTMNGGASIEEALAANDLVSRMETTYIGLEGIQPVAFSIRRRIQGKPVVGHPGAKALWSPFASSFTGKFV